ncbi:unnamed protein product, partial [Ectocarpus sp. 12 AP-2014]
GEEKGASAWGHLWPLGRHTRCEELRRGIYQPGAREREPILEISCSLEIPDPTFVDRCG